MKKYSTIFIFTIGILVTASGNGWAGPDKKPTACDLKSDMRKLWEDHITWTRNVIFNIIDDLPGTTQAVNRLLQNQVDIGNAIKPYYGQNAGTQLTALLTDHITIAANLLTALKNDNTVAYDTVNAQWIANANAIAAFLSSANPNWPLAEMQAMMLEHLNLTGAEAVARKTDNYTADVTAFENVHVQILEMADMLTNGIVKQFPSMFRGCHEKHDKEPTSNNTIVLKQNTPNPFSNQTAISYFIPDHIRQAQIVVYDEKGTLINLFDIKTRGEGSTLFAAPLLRRGIFTYGIIADGKLIVSKKMMVQ